jgi:hypothetical protein
VVFSLSGDSGQTWRCPPALVDEHAANNEIETEKRRKPILARLRLDPTDYPVIMSEEYADR